MRIAEAAGLIGVETHVLRHWDDMRVLVPPRSPSGHRVYDPVLVDQGRLVRACQRAGLSLADIRQLGSEHPGEPAAIVSRHQAAVRDHIGHLQRTDRFLGHVLECTHRVVADCPECRSFAAVGDQGPAPHG